MSSSNDAPFVQPQNGTASPAAILSDIVSRYGKAIWATADVLRGVGAKGSDLPGHMMPFFALMLLESRALRAREAALLDFKGQFDPTDPTDVADMKGAYARETGGDQQTWQEDLVLHGQNLAHVVSGGPSGFSKRLRDYLAGFDDLTRRILGTNPAREAKAYLNIDGTIRYLDGKGGDQLFHYCRAWADVDLVDYDSSAITTLEEHIKRRWADISADTAGEHYTPSDLISLVAGLVVDHLQRHPLKRQFLRIYDPTCGGGNLLFGVEDVIRRHDQAGTLTNAAGERYSIATYGQELNDHLFALAKVESWFRPRADIREGNTLTEDQFTGELFDVIVANPPYGNDWKQIKDQIERDETGRFPAECRPPVSDGQHLFLQHIRSHLSDDGFAFVFCSGSTLFSGDAGGGESNARSQYILTEDGVWGLIQLPKNEFFNTGINTYIWVFKKGKTTSMQGRMFLLNAESLFTKLRKSLGSKNCQVNEEDQAGIIKLVAACEDPHKASMLLASPGAALSLARSIEGSVIPKVVEKGAVSSELPALLRLLPAEALHYNKVSLELVRSNEHGAFKSAIELSPMLLELGGDWLWSAWTLDSMAAFLSAKMGQEVAAEAKSVERAIKDRIRSGQVVRMMEAEGQPHYEWDPETHALMRDDQPLGRANLDLKIKAVKNKGKPTGLKFQVTLGPDIEKDTETAPFRANSNEQEREIRSFLDCWVKDEYTIVQVQPGCEINFNRLFPKTSERKSVVNINQALAVVDAQIAALHQEGA